MGIEEKIFLICKVIAHCTVLVYWDYMYVQNIERQYEISYIEDEEHFFVSCKKYEAERLSPFKFVKHKSCTYWNEICFLNVK